MSLIAKENYAVVKAVEEQTTAIAAAVDAVSNSFSNGGRLFLSAREPRAGSAFWMLRNVPLPSALSVIW